jgi:hypothetical protein
MILVTVGATAFVFWANDAAAASSEAIRAYQTDDQVTVTQEHGLVTFGWAGVESSTGLIFYPGSRVDYRAYAPLLREIAARGYFVVLTPMPLNLAFLNVDAADQVLAKYSDIQHWAIGGHSLGGAAASTYAANHPAIEAVIFWASYPADDSLKEEDIKVLSIYGSKDGLSTPSIIAESRTLLPADSVFVEIIGGNHAQFGSYGPQAGDNPATLSPEEQWMQVAEATVIFLDSLGGK